MWRARESCGLEGTRSSSFFTSSNGSKTTPLRVCVEAETEKERFLDFPEETGRLNEEEEEEERGEMSLLTPPWMFTSEKAEADLRSIFV